MDTLRLVRSLEDAPIFDLGGVERVSAGPLLDELRRESWLARTANGAVVLGREHVQLLLADRRLRSPVRDFIELQGVTSGLLHERFCQTLLALDGNDHARLRSLVRGVFTPKAVERHRLRIHDLLVDLVEPLQAAGHCEFMADIADHYPIQVICELLGVPSGDHVRFVNWLRGIGWALTLELASRRDEAEAAMMAIDDYVSELLVDRRSQPRDDLISELVRIEDGGDRLTEEELRSLVIGLLFAGYDTTRNQLGLAIWTFATHPDQWERLASEPDLAVGAVEEVMRYLGAVALAPRLVSETFDLDGYRLPAGTILMLSTASANHDSSADDDAHAFDTTAPRQPHLTFGGGPHYCLGASLARAEMTEALRVLPAAFAGLALDGEPRWRPAMNIWGPDYLPISFAPRPPGSAAPGR